MRVTIVENDKIVNIILAESVEGAQKFYPGAREWVPEDVIEPVASNEPDAELRAQFEIDKAAREQAEFQDFKARSGQPSYNAVTFKIAAEKLGLLEAIEAAIMDLVNQASDKSLYVWWNETPTISRGDAEWQQIEPAVAWGKVSADDLFALAAQL